MYDKRTQRATYGVGGAIVWDSVEAEELREIRLKSQVLESSGAHLAGALLETMRWEPGLGLFLKDRHFERLLASARYFSVPLEPAALQDAVDCVTEGLGSSVQRVRLLVSCDGAIDVHAEPLVLHPNQPQRVALATTAVDRKDVRFYHKSTERSFYDRASDSVGDDVEALLCNCDGEITESVIANVVYRIDDQLYTPPIACGLLGGTLRQQLLVDGVVRERILHKDELATVQQLYLVNALRGWREAQWIPNFRD